MPEEILETPQPTEPKPTNWPKVILLVLIGLGLLAAVSAVCQYAVLETWLPVERVGELCVDPGTDSVRSCVGGAVKIVSRLPGGGATFIKKDGTEVSCPVVAPSYISEDCKKLNRLVCLKNLCVD